MNITKAIKKLCTPAYVYLVMSMISIIILMAQNAGNDTKFCIGSYTCKVMSTSFVFFCQALYTAIWTFILDSVCKKGYNNISWFLVLFPYLLFFIIIGLFILGDKKKEGFKEGVAGTDWLNNEKNTSGTKTTASPAGEDSSSADEKVCNIDSDCSTKSGSECDNDSACMKSWGGACVSKSNSCYGTNNKTACSGHGSCVESHSHSQEVAPCKCKCNPGWGGSVCYDAVTPTTTPPNK